MTDDRTSRFWNRIAERYARDPVADEAAYQRKLEITRNYLRPDMDLVEFGCGTGSTAILHAPLVKCITAVDFSPRMLEIARTRAAAAGVENIDFVEAGVEGFAPRAAACDMVLALSLLHLVADRDAVIRKMHGLLKPGGIFVSSTACLGDSMPYIRLVAPLGAATGLLPRLGVFTRTQLRDSITAAGFAIEHDWLPGPGKAVFILARKAAG